VVAKNDPSGSGWTWTYTTNNSVTGVTAQHCALDIEVNGTGVYATGFTTNGSGNRDIFTVGLYASGGSQGTPLSGWPQTYSANGDEVATSLELDGSGNVYVAGWATITGQAKNGFLTKYGSSGGTALYTSLHDRGGAGNNRDDAWSDMEVTSGSDPAVFVGGYSSTDGGNMDYALRAYTSTLGNASGWGSPTVYYDGSYNAGAEPAGTDQGKAIEYSATTGRVYITGNSAEPCSTGCGSADVNITTLGYSSSDGSLVWNKASYDTNTDNVTGDDETYWSHCLNVYYSGCYASDIILVTGGTLITNQSFDYVTIQYGVGSGECSNLGSGEESRSMNSPAQPREIIGIYPNPFSSTAELRVESGKEVTNATLYISDVQGRIVAVQTNISSNRFVFDRGNLKTGLYFFKLTQDGSEFSNGKFVLVD